MIDKICIKTYIPRDIWSELREVWLEQNSNQIRHGDRHIYMTCEDVFHSRDKEGTYFTWLGVMEKRLTHKINFRFALNLIVRIVWDGKSSSDGTNSSLRRYINRDAKEKKGKGKQKEKKGKKVSFLLDILSQDFFLHCSWGREIK